ncbi:MAG: SDR family NAD(P)-dependent oxidoreductase [Candidatus Riflebacteria bacterium]|nr:SDR family NAD(P)-dependent oxidoreductase [Candidatus Riflebacteria bacterium]
MLNSLTFLWPGSRATEEIVALARTTGTGALFDLTGATPATAGPAVAAAGAGSVLVSFDQAADPAWADGLAATSLRHVFVQCPPALTPRLRELLVKRFAPTRSGPVLVPVTGDHELIRLLIDGSEPPRYLALKGNEAAGFGGADPTSVLFTAASRALEGRSRRPELLVWGGVALSEAVAAFLVTGARAVVFESVHWLTDLVAPSDAAQHILASLRPDCTRTVGGCLGLSCRVFDRGNSPAVRDLEKAARELASGEVGPAARQAFVDRVGATARPALSGDPGRQHAALLGTEALFATGFAERFGRSTRDALLAFSAAVRSCCAAAEATVDRFFHGPGARELGTALPFIQGAMTWITDRPELARLIADAGALPTLALGFRPRDHLARDLGDLAAAMGDRPYAVNVVVLPENSFRDEQLAWVEQLRPPFVVVAAGDPSFAGRLNSGGSRALYLAPDDALMRLAIKAGVRHLILEGMESGGHVGPHSTLTLAQLMLELRRREPELCRPVKVVLAGGLVDGPSIARAALLGADAVQLGTVYLTAREMVSTGALSSTYQELVAAAPPGSTVVTGETVGLPVRALETAKTRSIAALERRFVATGSDETEFRRELEGLAAGSLLIAARAVREPGGPALDETVCRHEGQFMCGAAAGSTGPVRSLDELHRHLSGPIADPRVPADLAPPAAPAAARPSHERIAVTAVALVNALGTSPEAVWKAAAALESGISAIGPERWSHDLYYDPKPQTPGKTYCRVGAFQNLEVSRKEIGVSPQDFARMTGSTKLTLWLARQAIADAGLADSAIPRERIGVVISQNSGEAAGRLNDVVRFVTTREVMGALRRDGGLDEAGLAAVERLYAGEGIPIDDTSLVGRLNCTAGGFVCNLHGFRGPSFSVSAACATSLVALYNAVHLIRSGVLDAAVVGGGEEPLTPAHYLEFAAVGALEGLSGNACPPRESSRPFDATRDGMVLGEGGAMVVVERESVARARGAPILGFITGIGASNNDRGLVESLAQTQTLAIRAAFDDAGYGADTVDLVECHATSTRQGDVEEVRALQEFYPEGRRTVLSSFKAQIGHTLGACGLSSLIRGLLALRHDLFPVTPTYRQPDPEISLESWGFVVPTGPLPWPPRSDRPRRLQVNAFGFGGTNYVVQLEEDTGERRLSAGSPPAPSPARSERTDRNDVEGVWLTVLRHPDATLNVAVVGQRELTPPELIGAVCPDGARPSAKQIQALTRRGIVVGDAASGPPPAALVFAGQGTQYAGMGRGLHESFAPIRDGMDRLSAAVRFDLAGRLFRGTEDELRNTRWLQPALFVMECAVARHLMSLGLKPAAMAGHSLGELSALCVAGVYSEEDGFGIVDLRARCMERAGVDSGDSGAMVAVDAPAGVLDQKLARHRDVLVTNDNSPRQVVLGGPTAQVLAVAEELKAEGFWTRRLAVSMAFHSPMMKVIRDDLEAFVSTLRFWPPKIPVVSNTTGEPFPDDPEEIKRILMRHLEEPVHWRQNVTSLWNDHGVRHFVEIGPRDVLSSMIADTVEGALCVPTCLPDDESGSYRLALARLYALGHLTPPAEPLRLAVGAAAAPAAEAGRAPVPAVEDELFERVVRLIMKATGYDRDEIQPDLDLRRDLAIRSSRLPVIMDGAEREFGIAVRLEDFVGVRTVRDLAHTVALVIARDGASPGRGARDAVAPSLLRAPAGEPPMTQPATPLFRHVFREAPVPAPERSGRLELPADAPVAILTVDPTSSLTGRLAQALTRGWRSPVIPVGVCGGPPGSGLPDLWTVPGSDDLARRLDGLGALAGLVVVLDGGSDDRLPGTDRVPTFLTGVFVALQRFVRSSRKAFCLLVRRDPALSDERLAVDEGIHGMLLAASLEYTSVLFRTLLLEPGVDPEAALCLALDPSVEPLQLLARRDGTHTVEAVVEPLRIDLSTTWPGARTGAVIVSGGGRGITPEVAAALAPLASHLALVGRTAPDPAIDYRGALAQAGGDVDAAARRLAGTAADVPDGEATSRPTRHRAALELARTLDSVGSRGASVSYHECDVTDRDAVDRLVGELASRHGRVAGIVHGAGIIHDAFLQFLTPELFRPVLDVKILGAHNLYRAARPHGLSFVVALSSAAAVQGNVGQASYCSANRAMAALVRSWASPTDGVRTLTLWLPPVEGAGMADQPEVRELLELRGLGDAFVHMREVAAVVCQELALCSAARDSVMPVRALPAVKGFRVRGGGPPDPGLLPTTTGLALSRRDFPLIDAVERLDLREGEAVVTRTFARERDLWLADHLPTRKLRHPLVSAIMAIEAFIETARLLHPELLVGELRDVTFREILECPPGIPRETTVTCRRVEVGPDGVVCQVSLSGPGLSPTGKVLDRRVAYFEGRVVLAAAPEPYPHDRRFAVSASDLDTPTKNRQGVLEKYEAHSGLTGRYRVVESIDGIGPAAMKASTVCRGSEDFHHLPGARTHYAAYVLEALQHLTMFHALDRDETERRSLLPTSIRRIVPVRPVADDEVLTVEGRLTSRTDDERVWDARAVDADGRVVVAVEGLSLRWFEA